MHDLAMHTLDHACAVAAVQERRGRSRLGEQSAEARRTAPENRGVEFATVRPMTIPERNPEWRRSRVRFMQHVSAVAAHAL